LTIAHIDDSASIGSLEHRVRQLGTQEDGTQIGSHHRIPFLYAGVNDRFRHLDSSVVDKGVEVARMGIRLVKDGFQVPTDGDVGLDEEAILGESIAKSRAVDADNTPTRPGEQADGCSTDAARCAGDEDSARV
jgi:hypothetical protein